MPKTTTVQNNPIYMLLISLVMEGTITGDGLKFMGHDLLPVGDDELEDVTDIYGADGISEPDEYGLVRFKSIDNELIPLIRDELGDVWANKIPQKYGLQVETYKALGIEINDLQHLRAAANANYAFFTRMPFALYRKVNESSNPRHRFDYDGIMPNARFVRDSNPTPESIRTEMEHFIRAQHKRSQSEADFSPH